MEAFGFTGPDVDAEQILMGARLWQDLGLDNIRLEINSLGQPEERAVHRAALIAYFETHKDQLDEDAQRRLHSNPLRILDTKNPAMQPLVTDAPRLMDYLGADSLAHFERVQALVRHAGIPFTINPRLVRGLDYYNLTVFEWVTDALGAQGTVCAGGRYDGLMADLGGDALSGIGFGLGTDRTLLACEAEGLTPFSSTNLDIFFIPFDHHGRVIITALLHQLRQRGVACDMAFDERSLKSAMKLADRSGAPFVALYGKDEAEQAVVQIKNMESGEQVSIASDAISIIEFLDQQNRKAKP